MKRSNKLRLETLEARQLLAADPVLSEFLASNQSALVDGNGNSSDWIEIRNAGDQAIDLSGWYLTDDPLKLDKWQFPDLPSSELVQQQYAVVFASGEDTPDGAGNLHTNFKLSANGEYVALVSPELNVVSQFGTADDEYAEQFEDVSYGIAANGSVGYFLAPTPGKANATAIDGFVADTKFSKDRGYYTAPFTVDVTSATLGATLVYTLDGSRPTLSNGTQVSASATESPLASIAIPTTTTLRAAAFRAGYEPTNVDTQTFVFLADVIRQSNDPVGFPSSWRTAPAADYAMDPQIVNNAAYTDELLAGLQDLPAMSLSSDVDGFFGRNGIYSNPQNENLEIPVSAEWILPDGTTGFQIDAGIKVSGGASRVPDKSPKHSLSLRFRSEYGAGRLNYKLFEDSDVESFNSLQLRAMFNNSWIHWDSGQQHRGTLIRDQFIRDSLLAMGQADAGHGTYAHVYINGLYWGVYNVHERMEASHYAEYQGGDSGDYDALNGGAAIDGTTRSYNAMRSVVNSRNWDAIQQVLDVDNFIDWTIAEAYGGNADLKLNGNWRAAGGGTGGGLWRIYSWDSERTLEGVTAQGPARMLDPMGILEDLVRVPEFVSRFGDRIQKHFYNEGALTPEATAERWSERVDELSSAIIAESARWGDYRRDVHRRGNDIQLYARDTHWTPEVNRLLDEYFPARSDFIVDEYAKLGLIAEVDAPVFQVNDTDQHGGIVSPGALIRFAAGADQTVVTNSVSVIDADSPVAQLVPSNNASETGAGPHWYEQAFDDTSWTHGTNGVGYETSGNNYNPFIQTDIQDAWNDNRSSVYLRFEFNLAQADLEFNALQLQMIYDDGFAVYLNGQFIDVDPTGNSNFAPTNLNWQSNSTGNDRSDTVVLSGAVPFDLTSHINLLHAGTNVLAIHGLNRSDTSSDMLMLPELVLQQTTAVAPTVYYTLDGSDPLSRNGAPTGTLFSDGIAITEATTVKARTRGDDQWSALLEATFTPAAVDRLLADFNGDRTVDFADFLTLSLHFGTQQEASQSQGDTDDDGDVDFADFLALSSEFGKRLQN